ncbi:nucleotidyltransferase family protein [Flavisphingomonas formosensis]|uniref:nucleotidyltransferase family protein n=1 Tax=Flavisphingomonas formosensis TaxID=861534 RepID=UPI0012FB4D3C|nr:NTP transferase domain-containing protein [Sphingomonas formosensis]
MRVAILLAAGRSTRFGSANKLMAPLAGRPLVLHALAAARAAPVARVVVVTGAQAPRIAATVRKAGVRVAVVRARDHRQGLSASLRAAFAALWPIERAVFVFLADMPSVPHEIAGRLLRRKTHARVGMIRPLWRGRPGHPVLLDRPDVRRIAALRGDRGLAALGSVHRYPVRARGVVRDVDRAAQLHGERPTHRPDESAG